MEKYSDQINKAESDRKNEEALVQQRATELKLLQEEEAAKKAEAEAREQDFLQAQAAHLRRRLRAPAARAQPAPRVLDAGAQGDPARGADAGRHQRAGGVRADAGRLHGRAHRLARRRPRARRAAACCPPAAPHPGRAGTAGP